MMYQKSNVQRLIQDANKINDLYFLIFEVFFLLMVFEIIICHINWQMSTRVFK